MESKLLTVPEVAEILNVSEERVYALARSGLKLGRQIRVDAGKLQQWIDCGGSALPGGWKHSVD